MMTPTFTSIFVSICALVCILPIIGVSSFNVMHMSDIHYDSLFGTAGAVGKCRSVDTPQIGLPGCDSSLYMTTLAIESMHRDAIENDARLIIYSGDWVRHKTDHLPHPYPVMQDAVETVSALIAKNSNLSSNAMTLVHPNFMLSLGNEDFYPDYHINTSKKFHPILANYSKTFQKHGLMSSVEAQTFEMCGFFARDVPNSNLTILTLNTILYSQRHLPQNKMEDPCGQFAWMRSQLERALEAGRRVYTLAHIPPSAALWVPSYYPVYRKIIMAYNSIISAQFFGHTHRYSFAAIAKSGAPPAFVGGPITRASRTNPNFARHTVDSEWVVQESTQVYFNGTVFTPGLELKQQMDLPDLSVTSLYHCGQKMVNNQTYFNRFFKMFEGGYMLKNCTGSCQKLVACDTFAISVSEAGMCVLGGGN